MSFRLKPLDYVGGSRQVRAQTYRVINPLRSDIKKNLRLLFVLKLNM